MVLFLRSCTQTHFCNQGMALMAGSYHSYESSSWFSRRFETEGWKLQWLCIVERYGIVKLSSTRVDIENISPTQYSGNIFFFIINDNNGINRNEFVKTWTTVKLAKGLLHWNILYTSWFKQSYSLSPLPLLFFIFSINPLVWRLFFGLFSQNFQFNIHFHRLR